MLGIDFIEQATLNPPCPCFNRVTGLNIRTHVLADTGLLGTPLAMEDDSKAIVCLETTSDMVVDELGLVHGGFVFGLADYAAMLAVNDPNVVLSEAKVKFTAPVVAGQALKAEARVVEKVGRRRSVSVEVRTEDRSVMEGDFLCVVLSEHVLKRKQ